MQRPGDFDERAWPGSKREWPFATTRRRSAHCSPGGHRRAARVNHAGRIGRRKIFGAQRRHAHVWAAMTAQRRKSHTKSHFRGRIPGLFSDPCASWTPSLRTYTDWQDPPPGFAEADLVAHTRELCPDAGSHRYRHGMGGVRPLAVPRADARERGLDGRPQAPAVRPARVTLYVFQHLMISALHLPRVPRSAKRGGEPGA